MANSLSDTCMLGLVSKEAMAPQKFRTSFLKKIPFPFLRISLKCLFWDSFVCFPRP